MILVLVLVLVMGARAKPGVRRVCSGVVVLFGVMETDREARRMMLLGLMQAALHSRPARPMLGTPGARLYVSMCAAVQQLRTYWPA